LCNRLFFVFVIVGGIVSRSNFSFSGIFTDFYVILQVMSPESSFDQLLNHVERSHQLACDPDAGGCGELNYIHHILSTPPHVFTTGELRVVRKIFTLVLFLC
jgi:hypothetical protein